MRIRIIEKYKNKIGLYFNPPLHKGEKSDYIFVHINKAAGTSIIKIIGKPFRKHLTAKEIIKVIGQDKWDKAYKFTVVRNPWDKVVSQYKHNIKNNISNMAKKEISFKDWVASTYGKNKVEYYYNRPQLFLPQVEWLKDFEGKIDLDKIIRFENLTDEMNQVFNTIGIHQELPHVNKTSKTNYRDFYDEATQKIIADWFHEDIKVFGYTY